MSAKRYKSRSLNASFSEALRRLAQTKPGEMADVIVRDLAEEMKRAEERIKEAREEINRGARTRGKRFRI